MTERFDSRPSFKFRMIGKIVRASGLAYATVAFIVVFLLAAVFIWLNEPMMNSYGDALWFLYQVVATIGLGDFTCTTALGRIVVVIVSVLSIFLLAVLTGAVVAFCGELMRERREEAVSHFLVKIEHLHELTEEELEELSESVRAYREWRGKNPAEAPPRAREDAGPGEGPADGPGGRE